MYSKGTAPEPFPFSHFICRAARPLAADLQYEFAVNRRLSDCSLPGRRGRRPLRAIPGNLCVFAENLLLSHCFLPGD